MRVMAKSSTRPVCEKDRSDSGWWSGPIWGLEDDWNADRVFAIIDASQARYEIIVAEATDGKDAATANRLKARLKESFDMGFSFGEGYASGGHCQTKRG